MRNIVSKKVVYSAVIAAVITVPVSHVVHAAQIGEPAVRVYVSATAADALDSVNCGLTQGVLPCQTIQHAVHRVKEPWGGILVSAGTYRENVLVDKIGVTLVALDGTLNTIIDGSGATNNTVPEAMRIVADYVRVGDGRNRGFLFQNSVGSGLFSIGNNVSVSNNIAQNNRGRGFQFGVSTRGARDSLDNSARVVADDPLNGATSAPDAAVQTQSNVRVSSNVASSNDLGGFYFSAFDDSIVGGNVANNNGDPSQQFGGEIAGLGFGTGFWIDSGSNRGLFTNNQADSNTGHGIFYRRGFGVEPEGLVTDQRVTRNTATRNGRNGLILMGDNITVQDNTADQNGGDGIHFIGYDIVLDVSYNAVLDNAGAGIGFSNFAGTMQVQPINLDPQGIPTDSGGIHHNVFSGNLAHKFPALGAAVNCAIATNVSGRTIELANNVWGTGTAPSAEQAICDVSSSTIVRVSANPGGGAGPRP